MIEKSLDKLIEVASSPLAPSLQEAAQSCQFLDSRSELRELLLVRNGFYAFESSLYVRPAFATDLHLGIVEWNSPTLWRCRYPDIPSEACFFAEDVFGGQFCDISSKIYRFDPETGEFEEHSPDLLEWASIILSDYDSEVGYPLAHEWQTTHGTLPPEHRLIPRVPFVLGGDYAAGNLLCLSTTRGMLRRSELAALIQDLPDGSTIQFSITD